MFVWSGEGGPFTCPNESEADHFLHQQEVLCWKCKVVLGLPVEHLFAELGKVGCDCIGRTEVMPSGCCWAPVTLAKVKVSESCSPMASGGQQFGHYCVICFSQ